MFRIEIKFAALRSNLSHEDRRELGDHEIQRWLRAAGFRRLGEYWLVREADLGVLDPAEVTSAEILDDGESGPAAPTIRLN